MIHSNLKLDPSVLDTEKLIQISMPIAYHLFNSCLGTAESTMQWVIYEYLKTKLAERRKKNQNVTLGVNSMMKEGTNYWHWWLDNFIAAGSAKLLAACVTYPHEVS